MTRWAKRLGFLALGLLAAGYAGVCAYMYGQQRTLLFRPDTADVRAAVSGLAGASALTLTTEDGERLNAWWRPPAKPDGVVFLYLHGNAANLTRRTARFAQLIDDGAGLLAVSWRGYGGSSGSPSEAGFHRDALAAYRWLKQAQTGARLVVFGESLGTAPAIRLAATQAVDGLILDAPYSSIAEIGQSRYPLLPVRLLLRDPFDAVRDAPQVTVPVLARLCREDWATPLPFARRLIAALPQPPELHILDRRCHVPDLREALLPALPGFLERVRAARRSS